MTLDQKPISKNSAASNGAREVVVLSSSLLTDRMLLNTKFVPELAKHSRVRLWTMSARTNEFSQPDHTKAAVVEAFPEVRPFKTFPHTYGRRLNEAVWDWAQKSASRTSIRKHIPERFGGPLVRSLRYPAYVLAALGVEQSLEDWLEQLCISYPRSAEAVEKLKAIRPAAVIATGPHRYEEPAIIAAAKALGIPVMTLITSWDNLSTKHRMLFKYDGYIVWSEQMENDLHEFYPQTRGLPVYRVGAPQFDAFFNQDYNQTREEFCHEQGLDQSKPIILHALGSPNFIPGEYHAALYLADKVAKGELGEVQMLIRPHPLFETGKESALMSGFGPRVKLQRTGQAGMQLPTRSQDEEQVIEWVNTFRHCDVLVNLFSTVAIDAAIFDRPVVNLDYDPGPEKRMQAMIKDVNHVWSHFKPITESGGMWTVQSNEAMVEAVRAYLKDPSLHRERRRWIAEYVCGHLDGRCGERMAGAITDFTSRHAALAGQSMNGH